MSKENKKLDLTQLIDHCSLSDYCGLDDKLLHYNRNERIIYGCLIYNFFLQNIFENDNLKDT